MSAKALCFRADTLPPSFMCSSRQILLLQYLMNSLNSFDKIDREYSLARTDDLIRFAVLRIRLQLGRCRNLLTLTLEVRGEGHSSPRRRWVSKFKVHLLVLSLKELLSHTNHHDRLLETQASVIHQLRWPTSKSCEQQVFIINSCSGNNLWDKFNHCRLLQWYW